VTKGLRPEKLTLKVGDDTDTAARSRRYTRNVHRAAHPTVLAVDIKIATAAIESWHIPVAVLLVVAALVLRHYNAQGRAPHEQAVGKAATQHFEFLRSLSSNKPIQQSKLQAAALDGVLLVRLTPTCSCAGGRVCLGTMHRALISDNSWRLQA